MSSAMFDSNTYGIGELITQRKLFAVPLHQRNYSWGEEQVEQFLSDIKAAFNASTMDYFIGLMVLQGPQNGVWEVLDGQQRLTTVTTIYSAIRNWLKERNFSDDANQIEAEYLGVRQLGGQFSPRVRLNSLNHDVFERHVIRSSPTVELQQEKFHIGKKTSNYLLLNAAVICREWVSEFADQLGESIDSKAKGLFQLSRFLETGVKVVSVDVATDADAFILFESLNNRGADLSALDLVKNYIFSIADSSTFPRLESMWERLTQLIEGTDADDFLKYFWTARFGIVQKSDLFQKIRSAFKGDDAAERLLGELLDAAEFSEALNEDNHPIWMNYSRTTMESLSGIKAIGSKQARPLLYSAVKKLNEENLGVFLNDLIVGLVRFQMIGHGRTGVLEKVLGRISPAIWQLSLPSRAEWLPLMKELLTSDDQFVSDFNVHQEQKISRAHYLLIEIEKLEVSDLTLLTDSRTIYLRPSDSDSADETYKKLGSYFILEKSIYTDYVKAIKNCARQDVIDISKKYFAISSFATTANIADMGGWDIEAAELRTATLASEAVKRWNIR